MFYSHYLLDPNTVSMPTKRTPAKKNALKKQAARPATPSTKSKSFAKASSLLPYSEKHLLEALNTANMGVWEWDLRKKHIQWSPNVHKIFGVSRKAFDGTFETYLSFIHPEDRVRLQETVNEALTQGVPYFIEHRIVWPDGAVRWVEAMGKVIFSKAQKAIRMTGTVQDITFRKTLELEREDWKNRHELISLSAGLVIYDYEVNTDTIIWSNNLKEVLGYTPREMSTIEKWTDRIHIEDRPSVIEQLDAARKDLHPYDVCYRFRMKSGQYCYFHDRGFFSHDSTTHCTRMLGMMNDVSRRIQAETTIRQSEQSYRDLFNTVGEAIYIHDPQGVFIDVNDGACQMYGYEKHEFIGRTPAFLSAPNKNNFVHLAAIMQMALEGERQAFEWWGLRKNGSEFLKEVRMTRGSYFGRTVLITTAWDITRRREDEMALKTSEKRFKEMIRDMTVGVVVYAPNMQIQLTNQAMLDMVGLTESEIIGKVPTRDLPLTAIKEDGTLYSAEDYPIVQATRKKQPIRGMVMGLYNAKRESYTWTLINTQPLQGQNGEIVQIICTFTDITARKKAEEALQESEQRFRILQQASFGGIGLHDKGIIIDCNQGLADITGYTQEELVGMNGLDLIAPEWRGVTLQNIMSGNEKPYDVQGVRADGSFYFLEIHAKNIPYKGQSIRVTEFRDITERKLAEEKIIDQNSRLTTVSEDLRRKNEQLEEFTQIVSHNLRSPVGNILTLISFFENAEVEDERGDYLRLIKESSTNLLKTLHELNEVLQIKQNKNIEKQHITFDEVFKHVCGMLNAKIVEANADLSADFSEAPEIDYPNIYMESIFLNLLSNALKYTFPGRRPVIRLRTYHQGDMTFLEISDNGAGINLDRYGHHVFKLRKTFHRHPESRGIGLFMIKNQIETMGGEITISSKENEGTTFYVNFNRNPTDGN